MIFHGFTRFNPMSTFNLALLSIAMPVALLSIRASLDPGALPGAGDPFAAAVDAAGPKARAGRVVVGTTS